jgi:hemolysin activation/secretion protein
MTSTKSNALRAFTVFGYLLATLFSASRWSVASPIDPVALPPVADASSDTSASLPAANIAGATSSASSKAGATNGNAPSADLTSPPPLSEASKNAIAHAPPKDTTMRFYVQEYRVEGGGRILTQMETEEAVYPYMGPYRTAADVEQARAALEKAYRDKGYQTVTVSIPAQHARTGIILLQVNQGEIGRLRVLGSRYFSIDEIKREAPSLQEGQSPNFSQVTHDLVVLNQLSDRQITPTLRPGEIPGTVDVDLNVKDTAPVHGSLEINNRYSAFTSALRINGSASYDNLWQLGHSIGFSFQLSPEDLSQVKVFSGYYLARVPDVNWLSLEVQGTDQDSNVSTLTGIGVAGKGHVVGLRAIMTLPSLKAFYQSLSLGLDYKHFEQDTSTTGSDEGGSSSGSTPIEVTPVTYYLFSAAYSASAIGKGYETDVNAAINMSFRGLGSDETTFDKNRFGSDAGFIYFRGDVSHTHDIIGGAQIFVKAQGQASEKPLVNSEQFSGGGLGTVRGYLESEALGDNGVFASTELRTPSLGDLLGKEVDDWRFYLFAEGGVLTIDDALPEQQEEFKLASVGIGTRFKVANHYNGSFDVGLPLDNGPNTNAYEPLLTFRLWAEF